MGKVLAVRQDRRPSVARRPLDTILIVSHKAKTSTLAQRGQMPSRRQKRVADLIHEELGDLLQKKISDPRIEFVTITAVEVSPDLRQAHAYVSVLGGPEASQQALSGLHHATGFIRRELASRLALRHTPNLTFHLDDSLERGDRILHLLAQIREEETNREQDTL